MHWTETSVTNKNPINLKCNLTALSVLPGLRMNHSRWDTVCVSSLWGDGQTWRRKMSGINSGRPANVNKTFTQTNTFFWKLSGTEMNWKVKKGVLCVKHDPNWFIIFCHNTTVEIPLLSFSFNVTLPLLVFETCLPHTTMFGETP